MPRRTLPITPLGPTMLVAAVAAAVAAAGSRADDAVALALRSEADRRTDWTLTAKTSGELEVARMDATPAPVPENGGGEAAPTGPVKVTLAAEVGVGYHTIDRAAGDDGRLAFELGLDRLALKRSLGGRPVSELVLTAEGLARAGAAPQSLEGTGFEKLMAGPVARVQIEPDGRGTTAAPTATASGAPDALSFETLALLLVPCLPEGGARVAPGARWKGSRPVTTELVLDDPVDLAFDYELKTVADGMATIAVTGTLELAGVRGTNARGAGAEVERMKLVAKGTIALDIARGQVASASLEVEQTSVVRPDGGAGGGERLTATLATRYELKRVED